MFTKKSVFQVFSVLLILAMLTGTAAARPLDAALGTGFTYQGKLSDGGLPANGVYDLEFKLFDALVDGTQVGSTVTHEDVTVTAGLFTVQLDFGDVFDGTELYLEIGVRPGASLDPYTALAPRQPLSATPYALHAAQAGNTKLLGNQPATYYQNASNIDAGTLGVDYYSAYADLGAEGYLGNAADDLALNNGTLQTMLNADLLDGLNASAFALAPHNHWGQTWSGSGTGLTLSGGTIGLSGSGSSIGVYGSASNYGLYGTGDTGVYGNGSTGIYGVGITGVRGEVWTSGGYGVHGINNASNGYGVFGVDNASGGVGVYGGGNNYGVQGSGSTGVYGTGNTGVMGQGSTGVQGNDTSGSGYGIYGSSSNRGVFGSGGTFGVYGSGNTYGVYGSSGNYGVFGSGYYGVMGQDSSGSGYGVFGSSSNRGVMGSGGTYGVYGSSSSTGVYGTGITGVSGQGSGYGVTGGDTSGSGYGIYGSSANRGVGGFGGSTGVYGQGTYGVFAQSTSSGAPALYSVAASGPYTNYAGYFIGNVFIQGNYQATGSKSAVVETQDHGTRALYTVESPENWFEDFGTGQLTKGEAVITIEPVFAQTVNLTDDYHVFLTPMGDCALYLAAKSPTSFTVRAMGGQTCSIAFDYRIVAKRLGYEDVRLAPIDSTLPTVEPSSGSTK